MITARTSICSQEGRYGSRSSAGSTLSGKPAEPVQAVEAVAKSPGGRWTSGEALQARMGPVEAVGGVSSLPKTAR